MVTTANFFFLQHLSFFFKHLAAFPRAPHIFHLKKKQSNHLDVRATAPPTIISSRSRYTRSMLNTS